MIRSPQLVIALLFITLAALACVTNTPVAKAPTPRPTRTAMPTFTVTPQPPTPTPPPTATNTPIPSDTPTLLPTEPPTNTPMPTDTPPPAASPTDTPLPTAPPKPTARPIQPTTTPMPTATAAVVINSPLPTPPPADPGTAPGKYEIADAVGKQNCESISITGKITEADGNTPIQFVVIDVRGEKDKYKGPYLGKSDAQGQYVISVGPLNEVGSVIFEAKITGAAGVTSKSTRWKTSKDCHEDGGIQTMTINWLRK